MSESLITFRFNPQKSAQIFKQLCKERGIKRQSLASRTGISYDTVENCLKGRGDLSFERVFKFCVVLGLPIESYMRLMLKDEDIDFADDVLLYNLANGEQLPISDDIVDDVPHAVPASVADAATAAAALPIVPPVSTTGAIYTKDELAAILDRQDRSFASHVSDLRKQLEYQEKLISNLLHLLSKE